MRKGLGVSRLGLLWSEFEHPGVRDPCENSCLGGCEEVQERRAGCAAAWRPWERWVGLAREEASGRQTFGCDEALKY